MNFVNFVNIKTNFPCNQNQFPHQIYWRSHRMTFTIGSWNIYTIWDWAWAWARADGFSSLLFFERVRHEPDATIWKPSNHKMKNGRLQSGLSVAVELSNSIQLLLILFISQSLKPFTRVFIEKSTSKYTHFLILRLKWKKCLFSFRSYLHWVWNVRFVFASHSNEKVKRTHNCNLIFAVLIFQCLFESEAKSAYFVRGTTVLSGILIIVVMKNGYHWSQRFYPQKQHICGICWVWIG